jgi:hypothetical protein
MFVLLIAQGNWSNCSEKWRLEALEALSVKEKKRRGSTGKSKEEEREKKEDAAKERRSPGWDALRRCREGGLYFAGTLDLPHGH